MRTTEFRVYKTGSDTYAVLDVVMDIEVAEYKSDNIARDMRAMRKALEQHIAYGGCLSNYQF